MSGRKPITQCTDTEWREIVQHARAVCPPPKGWRYRMYRSASLKDAHATCLVRFDRKLITIKVGRGYSEPYTRDLVAHELAHALAWQHSPHVFAADHDETWAQCYVQLRHALVAVKFAKIYNAMHTDR
jgi:hypothetical protein